MNADTLKGQWHQLKGEVKTQWGKLTDDDLDQVAGHSEKLIGKLQERYGYQKDEAEKLREILAAVEIVTRRLRDHHGGRRRSAP